MSDAIPAAEGSADAANGPGGPVATQTEDRKTEARKTELSPSRIATGSFLLSLIAYLLFLLNRVLLPDQWEFALEVETEVASVELQPGVVAQWRVDGAALCTSTDVQLAEDFALENAQAICGGRRWSGWRIDQPEQVITVQGGSVVRMELLDDRLSLSLRAESGSLGAFEAVGTVAPVALDGAVNLFWDLTDQAGALTFPFTGTTTLGRAVSWSEGAMLRSGSVAVFTADESADRRTLVDEAALMLGDQVRLDRVRMANSAEQDIWPKGFIRAGEAGLLEVVAFGRADSLSIDRYGDSGYDFSPGFLARVASDPQIAFWGSMLIAYMTVVFSLIPFLEENTVAPDDAAGRPRFLRWLMRYRD